MASDDSDVLLKADALMQRHRSFVARSAEEAQAVPQAAEELDIPILTEVVVADETTPQGIDAILDALHKDIERELSNWLVEALPAAVMNASQHILAELDTKARHSLLPRLQEILAARRAKPD
jgi:hypothetical protein